jgi:hypothetical protein
MIMVRGVRQQHEAMASSQARTARHIRPASARRTLTKGGSFLVWGRP